MPGGDGALFTLEVKTEGLSSGLSRLLGGISKESSSREGSCSGKADSGGPCIGGSSKSKEGDGGERILHGGVFDVVQCTTGASMPQSRIDVGEKQGLMFSNDNCAYETCVCSLPPHLHWLRDAVSTNLRICHLPPPVVLLIFVMVWCQAQVQSACRVRTISSICGPVGGHRNRRIYKWNRNMEPKIGYDIFLPLVLSSQTLSYVTDVLMKDARKKVCTLHTTSLFVSFLPVLYLLVL